MRRGTLFWGVLLVLGGLVLLLDNLGILGNINVWNFLWPLALILLGVWILIGSRMGGSSEIDHATLALEGATSARIKLQHGAGRMNLFAGVSPGNLLEGDFGGGVEKSVRKQGDQLEVKLNTAAQFFPFFWAPGFSLDWSVGLSREVSLWLEVETGASESRLDLTELKISKLVLKSGASSTHLSLPANAGMTGVEIESGVASVEVQIPAGVAARIRSRGGLSSIHVDGSRFPRSGDTYQSTDYDTAANKVELDIQMGVGSVSVR